MNNVNNIINIKSNTIRPDIPNSNYKIVYKITFNEAYEYENKYMYILMYNKGTSTFIKKYLSDNHEDHVYPDNLLNDYRQTDSIPSLWNEFVECYISAHKENDKILPLIKQIKVKGNNKLVGISDLKDRQEIFSKLELNEKLKNIELP